MEAERSFPEERVREVDRPRVAAARDDLEMAVARVAVAAASGVEVVDGDEGRPHVTD